MYGLLIYICHVCLQENILLVKPTYVLVTFFLSLNAVQRANETKRTRWISLVRTISEYISGKDVERKTLLQILSVQMLHFSGY